MKRFGSIAAAAVAAATLGACQQQTAQQLNTANANSQVYVGALTCNVSGSTGYIFGSTKDLSCIYLTKDGVAQAYDGKIRKFGIDIGYTKAAHLVWHVYQLGGLIGDATSPNPRLLAGNYGGEQASVAVSSSAGGNWLYGGSNNQIVLQATQLQDSGDAGYNLAYGIAEMGLTLKN
ncbi:MAG: DUF992 domain-containing protein [Alphaproteobacteria bacterium]|nr:DUF992 domain-containing protein [Alphaproteobacteria bacterium]